MQKIGELYGTFQQLLHMITGIPLNRIILANQGRSPPAGNELYATYNPIPVRAYGHVSRTHEEIDPIEPVSITGLKDLNETVHTNMMFMLSVNFFNEGAADAAMSLANADLHEPITQFLYENNIGWRYVSNLRSLAGIYQAGVQPRYQADIHLFIEKTTSYAVLQAAGFSYIIYVEDT